MQDDKQTSALADNTAKVMPLNSGAGSQAEPALTDPDKIHVATPNPPITKVARDEQRDADVESRGARLSSNLLEQKHSLIELVVSVVGLVIMALYITFIVTIWSLFTSKAAFTGGLPVTGVVLVGLTGSIPTVLSIFLLVGLLSNKDSSKDKEDKAPLSEIGTIAKLVTEVAKHAKHLN